MLAHFLAEFNGFNRIQGGQLAYLLRNEIILGDDIDAIIGYIKGSPLRDVLLLINPASEHSEFAKRMLWLAWYSLKMEKVMSNITIENYEASLNDAGIKSLLFGEMNFSEMETLALAHEEDGSDDDDEDDDFDSLDEEDEDEDED